MRNVKRDEKYKNETLNKQNETKNKKMKRFYLKTKRKVL